VWACARRRQQEGGQEEQKGFSWAWSTPAGGFTCLQNEFYPLLFPFVEY
jgi:hypothetical protein